MSDLCLMDSSDAKGVDEIKRRSTSAKGSYAFARDPSGGFPFAEILAGNFKTLSFLCCRIAHESNFITPQQPDIVISTWRKTKA